MTNKEREMYDLIRQNPQISQNELAERLNITRSSVSVHISNLIKKGYIAGRGYVLNEIDYVVVIGAANVDILGFSTDPLIQEDSNPGSIEICLGGVGRNISENLSRLDTDVKLITTVGDDTFGKRILSECQQLKIDMSHSIIMEGQTSSSYIAIMDNNGEMSLALSDMSILDKMPTEHLRRKLPLINRAKLISVDAGLAQQSIEYILANCGNRPVFLDPVSIGKAKKVKHLIGGFHTIKLNRLEAEFLSDMKIETDADLPRVGEYFMNKGVKRVFITLGKKGVYYQTENASAMKTAPYARVVNATGAGDAFMAGIIYSSLKDKDNDFTAAFASAMANICVQSPKTVSEYISVENVLRKMEENFKAL